MSRKGITRYIKKIFGIVDKNLVFEVHGSHPRQFYDSEDYPICKCKSPKKDWNLSWAHANSWYRGKRESGYSWWTCKKCNLWGACEKVPWYMRFERRYL